MTEQDQRAFDEWLESMTDIRGAGVSPTKLAEIAYKAALIRGEAKADEAKACTKSLRDVSSFILGLLDHPTATVTEFDANTLRIALENYND